MMRSRTINNQVKRDGSNKKDVLSHSSNSSVNHSRNVRRGKGQTFLAIVSFVVFIMVAMSLTGLYTVLHIDTEGNAGTPPSPASAASFISTPKAREILNDVRRQFNERYKVEGKNGDTILTGTELLRQGLHTFGSIDHTAQRILDASRERRPFVFAFSGYSITVGRGNFFNQSFPFVAQNVLEEPMRQIFDIPLVVRNAAIGGIPSFPYGFCMEHFLGRDPDVISWDYSMNEGGGDSSILEAFLRQATRQLAKRPMVIMIDTNANRMRTLDEYTKRGWLRDAIAIGKKDILNEKQIFDETNTKQQLPAGFQEWNEFGAPKSCPGRGSWHPKKQEHSMMGWIIAMHFIEAMERAIVLKEEDTKLIERDGGDSSRKLKSSIMPKLGKPIQHALPANDAEVTELLFGHPNEKDEYVMKELSCRTSFLPATDHEKTLTSVVVSGIGDGDLDIMIDRTDDDYRKGWVLDVSKVERDTKRKVERCGGLGYIDMKIALYGVPDSGTLRLWLPFEGPSHDHHGHDKDDESSDITARHWFDDFIICEANEKRDAKACHLDQDMEIVVGGIPVTAISPVKGAAEYLKRTTCVNVGVPEAAKVTALGDVRTTGGKSLSQEDKKKFGAYGDDALGMVVDVTVKPIVTRTDGACCLSHIVWEQH